MDSNTWLIILLAVVMIVCCGPMLFMRKHRGNSREDHEKDRVAKADDHEPK